MRDLNREAWFLYQVTSIEHFERCAQACQEFAEIFDQLMTKHDVHGYANLDYWVREYYSAAKDIKRYIELVKVGDYMPMISELNAADANYRGFSEQPDGWMTDEERKEWIAAFRRLSDLCGYANEAMRNNKWKGINWVERDEHKDEDDFLEMLDRDDGFKGIYAEEVINNLQEKNLLPKPDHYPQYRIDKTRSCRAGETCPWAGVWVPEQAFTEGLEKFSLAFAMAGRPMQPAYRIVRMEKVTMYEPDPEIREIMGEDADQTTFSPITKAEDALWYPVVQVEAAAEARADHGRLRALPNELVPQTGWWWSPAFTGTDALRHFNQGEHFPSTETTNYGGVFWYYDADRQPKE